MKKKNTLIYVALIAGPYIALMITAMLQVIVRFATRGGGDSAVTTFVNIIAFLIGIASVICILLLPLWIVLLIKALDHNKKLTSGNNAPVDQNHPPKRPS